MRHMNNSLVENVLLSSNHSMFFNNTLKTPNNILSPKMSVSTCAKCHDPLTHEIDDSDTEEIGRAHV